MKDFKLIYENFKNFEQKTEKDHALDQVKRLQPLLNETALDWHKHDRLQYIRENLKSFHVRNEKQELNEIFGLSKKERLIKKIVKLNPDMPKSPADVPEGSDEMDQEELKMMSVGELEAYYEKSKEGKDEFIDYDDRGFFAKVVDKIKGIGDVSLIGKGTGLLIGGDEVLDVKKRKALQDKAKRDIEGQLQQLDYEPLTDLYKKLLDAEFPNNEAFKSGADEIEQMYEDIKKKFESGEIFGVVANSIVAVMRSLVIYFQDYKMNDKFYYVKGKMNEAIWNAYKVGLITEQEKVADNAQEQEFFDGGNEGEKGEEGQVGTKYGTTSKNYQAAYSAKFPVGLALGGLTIVGAGYALNTPFVQEYIADAYKVKKVVKWTVFTTKLVTKSLGFGTVEPGEGLIHLVRRMGEGGANFGKSGGPSMGEIFNNPANEKMKIMLEESLKAQATKGGVVSPDEAVKYFNDAIQQNADPVKLFTGQMAGTGRTGQEIFAIDKGTFEAKVQETMTTSAEKSQEVVETSSAGEVMQSLVKQIGTFLSSVLGPAVLAGAGVSAAMRIKGKYFGSRARMLHDLGLRLKDLVPASKEEEEKEEIDAGQEPPQGDDTPDDTPGDTPGKEEAPGEDDGGAGGFAPQPEPGEDPEPEQEKKRKLVLVRLDDDGVKFHPGSKTRSPKKKEQERDLMQKAQDQGITGRNTDPSSDDLRNQFGVQGDTTPVADLPVDKLVKKVKGRGKLDLEPYMTVDASIYNDMAKAMKEAGLIKTARLNKKIKAAVEGTVEVLLKQITDKTPPRKMTYKQAQPTLIKQLRNNGLGKTSKNSKALFILLRALKEYGLIRGDIPEDPVEEPQGGDDRPDNLDANLFESRQKRSKSKRLNITKLFKN